MIHLVALIKRIYRGYTRNGGALTAAAISYYALVSMIPLLLLAISILGYLMGPEETAYKAIIIPILPGAYIRPNVEKTLHDLLGGISSARSFAGAVGILSLVWIGSQFFHVLEAALNRTWDTQSSRPFLKGRLMAMGVMTLCGALLLANLAFLIVTHWVRHLETPWMRLQSSHFPVVWVAIAYFTPWLFSVITFTLLYRLVPTCSVPWREALAGGVFAGVCWEIARTLFTLYIRDFGAASYTRLYGPLGGMALLVFWIYYTSNILVIGGEFARSWSEWKSDRSSHRARRMRSSPRTQTTRRRKGSNAVI